MRDRLKKILLQKSVIRGKNVVLSSGKHSNFYVDARMTTLDAEGSYLCGKIFLKMLNPYRIDAVGGYSIGADPIVSAIAVLSFLEKKPLSAFIIRKEIKAHGMQKSIEGNLPATGKVALFDDVVTSGGSILKGIAEVEATGAEVVVIMSVIDREEGGREKIEAGGYRFQSIFKKSDLI
jgi:orotate phosphoribosyltransferase